MRPRKIILLVEDNAQVCSTTKFLLETRGYRVFEVGNSDDALALFEQPVDLVLCDLVLDHEDGNVLCHRMKDLRPETPIVLYSGKIQNLDRVTAADSFLSKGSNSPAELLERVRLMVVRKRGPRKGWRRGQPAVAPANHGMRVQP